MTSIKQEIPTINISSDIENKSISSTSSETKENEYLPSSPSSSSSVSFEDKKVINNNSMATTNTTTIKNTLEDKQKKNEKRAKRNSFRRIKEEGEILVKSLFGKEKTDKSNKKQDFVPPSPRTKYRKARGNDDQQRANTYPVSDDDSSKTKTKARNRRSMNLTDFLKSDDDKKEMEKRRRTFHFTDSHKDIDFAVDNINDNSSSDSKNVTNIKTKFNPILSTAQYDSPIVENFHISGALSPTTNMSNKDEKTIIQNDNLITPVQNLVIKEDEKEEASKQKINGTRETVTSPSTTSTTSLDEEDEDDEDDDYGDFANSNNNNNNNNNNRDDNNGVDGNDDDNVIVQQFRRTSNVSNDTEISDDIEILNTNTNTNTNTDTNTDTPAKNNSNNNRDDDDDDDDVQKLGRTSNVSNDTGISDDIEILNATITTTTTTTATTKNNSNDQEKPIITAIINNILPEISPVNSFQNISSNKIVKTSSSINNNVDDSQTLNIIYSTHNKEDNEIDKNDHKQNDEKLMIVMTGEASNNNKMASNTKKIDIKNENKIEDNSRINTLEAIVLRQLDLAEKMQETMTRLESKVNEQKEDSLVSSQMEDTIRKLENKISKQDVELDGLKMIVEKLQENQQMMIANEAYNNQDLQTIHRELALFSQTSSTSTFSLTAQNLHQQQHQVYTKNTLVDTLVVRPLCNTITVSASIATSVIYAVYVRPAVGLFKILTR